MTIGGRSMILRGSCRHGCIRQEVDTVVHVAFFVAFANRLSCGSASIDPDLKIDMYVPAELSGIRPAIYHSHYCEKYRIGAFLQRNLSPGIRIDPNLDGSRSCVGAEEIPI